MIPYFIIRTKVGKEAYVTVALQHMGFDAWLPIEVRSHRTAIGRKTRQRTITAHPAIPKCLFAAVPVALHGDLQRIRYFDHIERDGASVPLSVPAIQVYRFRDALTEWNDTETRRIQAGNRGKPEKKRWVRLEAQTLGEVMATMFGDGKREG